MEGWPKSLVICAPGHTNREQAASLAPASGGNLNIMNLMGWYNMINLFIFLYISWYFISYIPAIFVLVVKSLTMSPPKSWYLTCVYIYTYTCVCIYALIHIHIPIEYRHWKSTTNFTARNFRRSIFRCPFIHNGHVFPFQYRKSWWSINLVSSCFNRIHSSGGCLLAFREVLNNDRGQYSFVLDQRRPSLNFGWNPQRGHFQQTQCWRIWLDSVSKNCGRTW